MKNKGIPGNKKWLIFLLIPLFCLLGAAGFIALSLTREPSLASSQSPNAVEASEANKKLKILDDSIKGARKGYVRLTELEVNSLIEVANKKQATNSASTNAPPRPITRTTVRMTKRDFTFVSWHKPSLILFSPTLPMQRTLQAGSETNKPAFQLTGMKVGKLTIPESMWPWFEQKLDPERRLLTEKMPWATKAVAFEITENETSKLPEFKLYSYMPASLRK